MAPEIEGKPAANMSGRIVEVPGEDLVAIESYLVKMLVLMEAISSLDIRSHSLFEGDNNNSDPLQDAIVGGSQLSCKPEVVQSLTSKQEELKHLNECVLLRLRNIIPRQKGLVEDARSNMNLKRSRPPSPLHVPRLPSVAAGSLDSELGILPDGLDSPHGNHGPTFDIGSSNAGEPGTLKFLKMENTTKGPFQKLPIFMPTAKVGVPNLDTANMPSAGNGVSTAGAIIGKCSSPKKRPSRSRRDRNRTRNKIPEPEPVLQFLKPGDTNKIPEDGWLWRKYGNKPIKTASYKRGYYKCRHFKEVKCNATKIVQQTNNDPSTFSVSYKGEHTCKQLGNVGGVSGRPPSGLQDSVSLADQVTDSLNARSPEDEKEDILEDMDCPFRDDTSDCASEDGFAPADMGEEPVDSGRTPVDPAQQPASPLISFDMLPIVNLAVDPTKIDIQTDIQTTSPWCETISATGDFKDFKSKYELAETCPPEGQDPDPMLLDEGDGRLLKMMHSELWGMNDISFWSADYSSFFEPSSDLLQ